MSFDWAGSAFVANQSAVAIAAIPPWVTTLFIQVAWGAIPQPVPPARLEELGERFELAAWAWCDGKDVQAEADVHRQQAQGYRAFVANLEEPYDAHGDQADPRYHMPAQYLAALHWDGPLGLTTTPLFASDMTTWRQAGAVYLPQAFPYENGAEVDDVVEHGQQWGWAVDRQRPLAQCYANTRGERPDGAVMNAQATELGVGLVPYVVEQATDDGGQQWLRDTQPSISRTTAATTPPAPEPEPEDTMDWWEHAYAGGPMVKVDGFPRPLYPPDAARKGKNPSIDGPDVIAYKRTVSRAGRWPWQTFDDSFSNAFSHGKSGNVKDTGIAGVQRQQHLDATGWIGEKTFNTLRSIRVPDGKPHAGEMAMDATAVNLINAAFAMFAGAEPVPEPTGSLRERALEQAAGELGYTETPAGSNLNKYGKWYGMDGQPWCAMFVTWAYETAGGSPSFKAGSSYSYCPYVVADARAGRNGLHTTDDPVPGDLVVYDWDWDTIYDHIGLFESWAGGGDFTAVEGNTSTSSDSNGGQVMRRTRNRTGQGTVFVRVTEP